MNKHHQELFLLFLFSTSLLFSCSNNNNLKVSYSESETLKEMIKERESDTKWSMELESNRLSSDLTIDENLVSKEVPSDNQTVKILKSYQEPVFPELKDFGSVNSSLLSNGQLAYINNFLDSLSTKYNEETEKYFLENFRFNYNFFKADLEKNWKSHFDMDFPEKNEEDFTLFSSYVVGEPVKYENELLVPVRLYNKNNYINILIFTNNDVNLALYNIQIEKWGTTSGK